ncbi:MULTISPECIES: TorD/DmsD family molecular chaperone [Enterobacterales]|uniref:TorD/DmsD family molecular chaperone n=1 Tax=Enterobacterales TaxID=91347 RepID=UPI00084823A4|nr:MULTISPECIES: molecular chaperone [Enterobacterales]WOO48114.1 molecular chaperone [Hafnia alvei]MCK9782088.1 molecular chaperone [Proteus columbae]MCT6517284.1 molecular chaperone [Proteus vulgaris]ODQ05395.1 molecular chaperone [Shigella sp. FC130]OEI92846.1 molecular chaperone [Shigella sp. FC1655]
MNEFSIVCRLLGTLFQREPKDPILSPIIKMIGDGKLSQLWPLEQDALFNTLKNSVNDLAIVDADYQSLFGGEAPAVSVYAHAYEAIKEGDIRQFLVSRGMPVTDNPTDSFGSLLLAASWLEDNAAEDEVLAQIQLFDEYLLPWAGTFLGKVESHATSGFYRTLAGITRGALSALREELSDEESDKAEDTEAE